MSKQVAVVLGTADTKGAELAHICSVLNGVGVSTRVVDVGLIGPAHCVVDVQADAVAEAAGSSIEVLRLGSRQEALATMAAGAQKFVRRWFAEGEISGIIAVGGSSGTSIAADVMEVLPLGFPKIVVSTQVVVSAASIARDGDVILVPTVADLAGVNRVTRPILRGAALALAGMVLHGYAEDPSARDDRPVVIASMIGITTPGVSHATQLLESADIEVVTFHVTGPGGRAMETLIGRIPAAGVLDASTVEVADLVVGSPRTVSSRRFCTAGQLGIPQVVSLGGLDISRFGPVGTIPERLRERAMHRHNSLVTLIRPSVDESALIGRELARRLAGARGPLKIMVPLAGFSSLSKPDGPLYDPEADAAVVDALVDALPIARRDSVEMLDSNLNDPWFSERLAASLLEMLRGDTNRGS